MINVHTLNISAYYIHYDKDLINCCFYCQAVGWLGKLMVDDMVALKWCMVLTSSLMWPAPRSSELMVVDGIYVFGSTW